MHRDVLRVYQQLGGAEGLLRWAQSSAENLGTFYAHVLRLGALLWLRPDVARHWDSTGDA